MYNKVEGGRIEVVQGIECWVPPVGYGVHRFTGEIVWVGVHSISPRKSDQKWERIELPADYDKLRLKEKKRQEQDPDYFDPSLEATRAKWWDYRMCGFWFMNNGNPTYITGTHWYYLNVCKTNIGFMDYRDTDRRVFYAMRSAEDDPRSAGITYVSRRRGGKTYMATAWQLDRMTLGIDKVSGIQSKTDPDAKAVFAKIVNYFVGMPHFFRPVYDDSQGLRPSKELRFFKATKRGKNSESILDGDELRSTMNFGSSESYYYDGSALYSYILDEFGKPQKSNTWDTWNIVRFCMDQDGQWVGKAFVTSTIEDLDVTGDGPKNIWDASNQNDRNETGRTKSGLYRIFFGAHESTFFDAYGIPDVQRGLTYYNAQRASFKNDTRGLSSMIRKNPFTIEEAFRVDGDTCLFDALKLNERLDVLSWKENITTRGNFVWQDGVRDSKVVWEPCDNGKWEVVELPKEASDTNKVTRKGDMVYPNNNNYVMGVDPIDHGITEDGRRSDGCAFVKRKWSPAKENDIYNGAFVCFYRHRPDNVSIFYEDMIKQAVFFGARVLFENNKIGMLRYFEERGYEKFLIQLPDRAQPGIAGTPRVHQYIAELTEQEINQNIHRVYFKGLILDWLNFDISKTTKFDAAMAAGYTLIADREIVFKAEYAKPVEASSLFKKHKVSR